MATTTNYNWSTPDDTSLVKDGAAAIRTLGSSIDTTTKALNPSTTLGDIEYRSSTANTNTRLGIGTTGQVLTVSGGVPTWASPAGGGKVLQVVQGTYSTEVSTTSNTTWSDTGLSATITPSATSSKILIFPFVAGVYKTGGNTNLGVQMNLLRGSTSINLPAGNILFNTVNGDHWGFFATNWLDSPSTTSATTYKMQFRSTQNTFQVGVQGNGSSYVSSIILMEIGA